MTLVQAAQVGEEDLLVTLGDYIDRGPNSCATLNWLVHRAQSGRLIALRGNHELMMMQSRTDPLWLDDWLAAGGDRTLESYPSLTDPQTLQVVPPHHWDFLENYCRDWHETETHFFVHANAYPTLSLDEQPESMLFWEKFRDPSPHESGKIMICGHTPQRSGRPRNLGHAICIDTFVYGPQGWLTCLEVATGHYWQANERGESREDWL